MHRRSRPHGGMICVLTAAVAFALPATAVTASALAAGQVTQSVSSWTEHSARNDLLSRIRGAAVGPGLGGPVKSLHDDAGNTMDTAKVIQVAADSYLAVYTTKSVVKLASSTNLVNWHYIVDLDPNASQPYLAEGPNGTFVLADEELDLAGQSPSHLGFLRYASLAALRRASRDNFYDPPHFLATLGHRFFSPCNEGTPDIHGITATGTVSFGFHYYSGSLSDCLQQTGVDREAYGTLRDFNAGNGVVWPEAVATASR